MGESGNGQRTKLVNQIICALNMVAMAEGLRLAKQSGLDLPRVLDAVSSGAAGSWILTNLGPRVLADDFAPGFMIKLQNKDLRLVLEAAEQLGQRLPGSALAYSLFSEAVDKGIGEQGTQGLINIYEESVPRGSR
jgi:3-hydroxyisobutyrate dehydrogenase